MGSGSGSGSGLGEPMMVARDPLPLMGTGSGSLPPAAAPAMTDFQAALTGRRLQDVTAWNVSAKGDCEGRQLQRFACNQGECLHDCTPQDAIFGEWGNWSAGDCTGLCIRKRGIAQHNNECGDPAKGALVETKRCHPDCHKPPVDCAWATWSDWMTQDETPGETCVGDDEYQKYRRRQIEVNATRGGVPCEGDSEEIA